MSETQEVAVRTPVHVGVRLTGLDEAWRLSQALAIAGVMPNALRGKPSDVLAILLYGQEVGLAPMQAIQGIYVVNGRPTLSAQTWIALARKAGHQVKVLDHTDTSCTVEITRGDTRETHRETYNLDDAKTAGLSTKDVWKAHPKRMTLARAVSNACRFACPEIALGFYSEADIDDLRDGVEDFDVVPPVTEPEAEDAEVIDEPVNPEELEALADQFDFSHATENADDNDE